MSTLTWKEEAPGGWYLRNEESMCVAVVVRGMDDHQFNGAWLGQDRNLLTGGGVRSFTSLEEAKAHIAARVRLQT